MQFQLTKEYLKELEENLETGAIRKVSEMLTGLQAPDIAEIMDELSDEHRLSFFKMVDEELSGEVFAELEADVREFLSEALSSKEIAEQVIEKIESDDAADVLGEMDEEKKEEVISHIDDAEHASDIVDLLNYDENTAGGLMAKELVQVELNWTVDECVAEIRRQAEDVDPVYTVYVTDERKQLVGRVSMKRLLLAGGHQKVEEIYINEIISVKAIRNSEEVASIMDKYDLVVLPVVDDLNRLIGRITIDDVVDVIVEEAEKDFQIASGISEKVESGDSVWLLTRARLPWLMIGLTGGIIGAKVIGAYEDDIARYTELAFFIPLIAAMGGNVGVQSSAIIVQGLANKTLQLESFWRRMIKELAVGLLNGLACATAIFAFNFIFAGNHMLSITVSVALLAVILFAAVFGALVPIALDKYKIDPALATGPFITTANDVLGLLLYFIICNWLYIMG